VSSGTEASRRPQKPCHKAIIEMVVTRPGIPLRNAWARKQKEAGIVWMILITSPTQDQCAYPLRPEQTGT
jgi:hypothetical protein